MSYPGQLLGEFIPLQKSSLCNLQLQLIDSNSILTCLGSFYAKRLGNCIHCTFISIFLCSCLRVYLSFSISLYWYVKILWNNFLIITWYDTDYVYFYSCQYNFYSLKKDRMSFMSKFFQIGHSYNSHWKKKQCLMASESSHSMRKC